MQTLTPMRSSTASTQGSSVKRSYSTMSETTAGSQESCDQLRNITMTGHAVRALLLDRHWVDCLNCTKARDTTACLRPVAATQLQICERCRRIKKACSSGVWLKKSNVRAYQDLLNKGVDVEHADQMVFGQITGLLGGPLDKHKEYGSAAEQDAICGTFSYKAALPSMPSLPLLPSESSFDVKDTKGVFADFKRLTPSIKVESSIAGSLCAPSDSTSAKSTTQLYFHKGNYHALPLVPIKDMRELRQLFNDVRKIYLENWIERRALGEHEQPDLRRL